MRRPKSKPPENDWLPLQLEQDKEFIRRVSLYPQIKTITKINNGQSETPNQIELINKNNGD
jgi:hypothetical protein